MGKVIVYTGQAGTGKTWSVINCLKKYIPKREWQKYEAILALTFMHGSRKRLEYSLGFVKTQTKIKCECATIHSFALQLVNSFRCYLDLDKPIKPGEAALETEFEYFMPLEKIEKKAALLLSFDSVRKYVGNSYPLVIIDEFQDCTGSLVEIIKLLSEATDLLIAADPFQQLTEPEDTAGMRWIGENCFEHTDLDSNGVKRTSNNKILLSATCLRKGELETGKKVDILPCASARGGKFPLGAYHLKSQIHYQFNHGTIAIISPTAKSKFVNYLLGSLSESYTFKLTQKKIGPYSHLVGRDAYFDPKSLLEDIPKCPLLRSTLTELKKSSNFVLKKCAVKLLRRISMRETESVSYDEFYQAVLETSHTFEHFYKRENAKKIIFTTVQGAKNREFDNVIVLWPYEVAGNDLKKRKLLYNALTRAKRSAVIIVQWRSNNLQELAEDSLFGLLVEKKPEDDSKTESIPVRVRKAVPKKKRRSE